jgi:choline transport protein
MANEKEATRVGSSSGSQNGSRTSLDEDAIKLETALGHKQELRRNFDLLSLTGLGFIIAK